MTPPLPLDDSDTPRAAAVRLYKLCDELELRALSERFRSHLASQFAFWERLENYARRQRSCW